MSKTSVPSPSRLKKSTGASNIGMAGGATVEVEVEKRPRSIASSGEAAAEIVTKSKKQVVINSSFDGGYGKLNTGYMNVHEFDYATIGTNEQLVNGGFTGSAASWTLSNFSYSANTITHAAASIGSASQPVTLKQFRNYKIEITLTTTVSGGIDFQVDGVTMLDDLGYYFFDPSTGTYIFNYLNYTATNATFRILTDINWAGSIDSISIIEVQQDYPYAFYNLPTDDQGFRNPQGFKFGRYNAGNFAQGDKQTMCMGGSSAVWNFAMGSRVLASNIDGFENVCGGSFAGRYTLTSRNFMWGYSAGKYNTLGYSLHFCGYKAGLSNTTGIRNHADGFHVLLQNRVGNDNYGSGFQALYSLKNTHRNTATGSQTGGNCIGTGNSFHGALAGYLNNDININYSYDYTSSYGSETKVYGNYGTALGWNASVGADGAPVDNACSLGHSVTNKVPNSTKIGLAQNVTTLSGVLRSRQVFDTNTTAVGATLTVAQFTASLLNRSSPTANFSDTTPTAAQIVATIGGVEAGSGYEIYIRNTSAFLLTLVAGVGVSLAGTTTVAGGRNRLYKVQVSNAAPGSEAVTVYGVGIQDN